MGGEIERIVTAVVLVAVVIAAVGLFIGDFSNNYPTTAQNVTEDNFAFLNKASELDSNMSEVSESLQNQQSEPVGFLETTYNVIAGAFGVLMRLFLVGDLAIGLIGGFGIIAASIGIQLDWFTGLLMVLVMVSVTIWVLRAVLKWEI